MPVLTLPEFVASWCHVSLQLAINVSSADGLLDREFGLITELVRAYAQERPRHPAVIEAYMGTEHA